VQDGPISCMMSDTVGGMNAVTAKSVKGVMGSN
jgi:hypothetical protein